MEATRGNSAVPSEGNSRNGSCVRKFCPEKFTRRLPKVIVDPKDTQEVPSNAQGVWLGIMVQDGRMPCGFGDGSGVIGSITDLSKVTDLTGKVGHFICGKFVEDVTVLDTKHSLLVEYLRDSFDLSSVEATQVADRILPLEILRNRFFEKQQRRTQRTDSHSSIPRCPVRARIMGLSVS